MQILGVLWAEPRADVSKRVRDLEALQASNGGWTDAESSADAYATGEVLHIAHALGQWRRVQPCGVRRSASTQAAGRALAKNDPRDPAAFESWLPHGLISGISSATA